MKKIIIPCLALIVLLSGCAARDKKCGDGTCQNWEKRNNSCATDCQKKIEVSQPEKEPATREPTSDSGPFKIKTMTTLKRYVKSLDWHPELDLILTAKKGTDGYFDVMVFKSDGSQEKCLTCDKTEIPQKHIGGPAWHPSGDYIAMTVEQEEMAKYPSLEKNAIPGSGVNCDLYIMDAEGTKFWKIYEIPFKTLNASAVIHPQFSHDGTKILWAERLGASDKPELGWGEWALKLADFAIVDSSPKLSNIRTLQLGDQPKQFYESHAFSPDDIKIMFSGNLETGQKATGLDIYEYEIASGVLNNLTNSTEDDDWDEHSHWSPDGTMMAWMSSTGLKIDYPGQDVWRGYLKTELWMANADGSNKTQLTHFNTPGYDEYMNGKRVIVSDSAWGPDGKHLVMAVAYFGGIGITGGDLVLVELE